MTSFAQDRITNPTTADAAFAVRALSRAAIDAKLKAVAGQKPKLEKDEAPQRPNKGDKEC